MAGQLYCDKCRRPVQFARGECPYCRHTPAVRGSRLTPGETIDLDGGYYAICIQCPNEVPEGETLCSRCRGVRGPDPLPVAPPVQLDSVRSPLRSRIGWFLATSAAIWGLVVVSRYVVTRLQTPDEPAPTPAATATVSQSITAKMGAAKAHGAASDAPAAESLAPREDVRPQDIAYPPPRKAGSGVTIQMPAGYGH